MMLSSGHSVSKVELGDWFVVDTQVLDELEPQQAEQLQGVFVQNGFEKLWTALHEG